MSSTTTTARGNQRQRTKRNQRGRGQRGGGSKADTPETKSVGASEAQVSATNDDAEVCWICAEPVKYYSVPECDHRTCHVCALRLRVLYKKLECAFCKAPQPTVIFTVSPNAEFSSFKPDGIPYKDSKLGIFFETDTMMEETLILLRFNCPDSTCDYNGTGWGDLKLHVRGTHGKAMCDLCIRFKKVFSHEHVLYPPNILPLHLPSIPHRFQKSPPDEQIEGGSHPLCRFCRECFYSNDEFYSHMKERHEECFVCKRMEIRDQYFKDYKHLEEHFEKVHHPCAQPQCQAQKFVVFGSVLDLKAHMVEVHGADMTARDKKDARRVPAEFEFDEVGVGGGGGRRGRGGGVFGVVGRGNRDSSQNVLAGPSRPYNGRGRGGFSGSLTVESGTSPPGPSRIASPSPPPGDPVQAQRLAVITDRLHSLSSHPTTAIPAVKASIRGFRTSESSARDLISTVWNILDQVLDDTAGVVNAIVDFIEEDEKKRELLSSWNGFKIEQRRQFPDLVPTGTGTGYAGIASGRVIKAKNTTTSQQSSGQLLERVARAAGSSSTRAPPPAPRLPERFPALQPALPATVIVPATRQGQRNTPWSAASAASSLRAPVSPVPGPSVNESRIQTSRAASPPALFNTLFPELPASATARQKVNVSGNQSLTNILTPVGSAWTAGAGASGSVVQGPGEDGSGDGSGPARSRKKGKQKQKQTLFTLGTFPS